jgi:hypothetical protein
VSEFGVLLEIARMLTALGLTVVPFGKDRKPLIKWRQRTDKLLSEEELWTWFSVDIDGNSRAKGLGIVLGSTARPCIAIDTDGPDATEAMLKELVPMCPQDIQDAFERTAHTKTPSGGFHWIFGINAEDFPYGIVQKETWGKIPIETAAVAHSEIELLPTRFFLREAGPGYLSIRGIEKLVVLSKQQVEELQKILAQFKKETNAIRTVGSSLKTFYRPGNRDNLTFAISGYLHRNAIPMYLTIRLVKHLIRITRYDDDDPEERIRVVEATYAKDRNNEVSGLEKLLGAADNNAIVVGEMQQVFNHLGYFRDYQNGTSKGSDIPGADGNAESNLANLVWIPPNIQQELAHHKWALIWHSPQTFMIAHSKFNQILEARIDSRETKQQSGQELKTYFLKLGKIHVNAIPIEVTTFEDPISVTLEQRYKIKFKTSARRIFTTRGPATLDAVLAELADRALVYSAQEGKEALSRIINAFENDDSIIISREIEAPGFYLIDGRIRTFHMNLEEHTTEESREAASFLNALVSKHYRKEIPATTVKWGIVAPFNYVLKQYTDDIYWIPWLGLSGWPRAGKGTQGRIACGIWGFYKDRRFYIPFTSVNTEARLGKKLSQSTLPLTINEIDALNYEWTKNMLEMIKNCIETRISRGKYASRTIYVDEPALSACILTSNSAFHSDPGFRSRIIYIVYTKDDKYWDEAQQKEFDAFMSKGRRFLKVLGDFAARYILDNQHVLLKENPEECNWKGSAEFVLQEFYKAADLPIPEWISLFVEEANVTAAAIQDASETAYFELRGFLEQAIIDGYRNDPIFDARENHREVAFQEKLDRCLNKRLVPYLHNHLNRTKLSEVVITHDIIRELIRYKISNITTMQALAKEIPGFEYGSLKLNGNTRRVVHGPYSDFTKFLNCSFDEE